MKLFGDDVSPSVFTASKVKSLLDHGVIACLEHWTTKPKTTGLIHRYLIYTR